MVINTVKQHTYYLLLSKGTLKESRYSRVEMSCGLHSMFKTV